MVKVVGKRQAAWQVEHGRIFQACSQDNAMRGRKDPNANSRAPQALLRLKRPRTEAPVGGPSFMGGCVIVGDSSCEGECKDSQAFDLAHPSGIVSSLRLACGPVVAHSIDLCLGVRVWSVPVPR